MKVLTEMRLFKAGNGIKIVPWLLALVLLGGCSSRHPLEADNELIDERQIRQLAMDISTLSQTIDRGEARHAARIAVTYSRQLADEYEIASSPLMHNLLVNMGIKQRGLCIHWTEDLQVKLRQQRFQTLEFHWAVANYEPMFRFEHSSVVVTPPGGEIAQGLLLDPWRNSGALYWSMTDSDEGYEWLPREVVRQMKLERLNRQSAGTS